MGFDCAFFLQDFLGPRASGPLTGLPATSPRRGEEPCGGARRFVPPSPRRGEGARRAVEGAGYASAPLFQDPHPCPSPQGGGRGSRVLPLFRDIKDISAVILGLVPRIHCRVHSLYPVAFRLLWQILGTSPRMTVDARAGRHAQPTPSPLWGGLGWGSEAKTCEAPYLPPCPSSGCRHLLPVVTGRRTQESNRSAPFSPSRRGEGPGRGMRGNRQGVPIP